MLAVSDLAFEEGLFDVIVREIFGGGYLFEDAHS
jgi:hypothetical protein